MKVLGVVLAFVLATQAVPLQQEDVEANNAIVDMFINRAVEFFRDLIKNGNSNIVPAVPPLDPFTVEDGVFTIPGDLISFKIDLKGANMSGPGDFVLERAELGLLSLRLRYDLRLPLISIRAAHYDMIGDIVGAIPLYGRGEASFDIENLRMVGTVQLGRSENGRSIIIREISDALFSLDGFVAKTTGYIGGGDIDNVINALLTDLVHDYVTRFSRHISDITTPVIVDVGNQIISQLDTWGMLFG